MWGINVTFQLFVILRNGCLFSGFIGEWIGAWDKQIAWTTWQFSDILFVSRSDSFPHEPWKKDIHSLNLQMNATNNDLFLNTLRNAINWKFPQWWALYLIWRINHCACDLPNCRTTCWQWVLGNLSWVQRRKYTTIVNTLYFPFFSYCAFTIFITYSIFGFKTETVAPGYLTSWMLMRFRCWFFLPGLVML